MQPSSSSDAPNGAQPTGPVSGPEPLHQPSRHPLGPWTKALIILVAVLILGGGNWLGYRYLWGHQSSAAQLPTETALTTAQQQNLQALAKKTWAFYSADLDPHTSLPRNSVVPSNPSQNGNYTSGTNIGFYLDSIVAAEDLHVISQAQAQQQASKLLTTMEKLATYRGFLYRWYDTATAQAIASPAGQPLTDEGQTDSDNTSSAGFISSVDDAWYAQSLVIARQAFPSLAPRYTKLLNEMNWSFLENTSANQMYIGYNVGSGYTKNTYRLFYGGPRIVLYMGIGTKTTPGSVWRGPARTNPAIKAQRQVPVGTTVTYTDPQSRKPVQVFEGHYTYEGQSYVPTWAGSMFQALAPDMVVPESSWGQQGLGANDRITATLQRKYGMNGLNYKIWGMAPATTYNNVTGYAQYGAPGLAIKKGNIPDDAVTPYATFLALSLTPQEAYRNYQTMIKDFPGLASGPYGLYDSVNPRTGQIAQRYMDVSQGSILMGIDNAVNNNELANYFGRDPVGQAVKPYVSLENFSLH